MTGLLHISDRLLAGELSRVEAARGTLHPLTDISITNCLSFKKIAIPRYPTCYTLFMHVLKNMFTYLCKRAKI